VIDDIPDKRVVQQLVKAGEVVHVPVRDEHVADAQELARHEPAKIEKQRTPLKNKIHLKPGIVEGSLTRVGPKWRDLARRPCRGVGGGRHRNLDFPVVAPLD